MIIGKNSWKGFVLLLYVVITLCAATCCMMAEFTFFKVVGTLLLLCNGYVTYDAYKALNG